MFPSTHERPTKRRIHEIDKKIKRISEVISSMTGHEKIHLERKLLTLELKKYKIQALSAFAEAQKMSGMLAEIDILDTENDLNMEIESIMKSKKFKKSESFMHMKESGDHFSVTSSNLAWSTSMNRTADATPHFQEIPESTLFDTTNLTKKDLKSYCHKAIENTTQMIKNKSITESLSPRTENVPLAKENNTELAKSSYKDTKINNYDTENITSSPQTEKASSSKTIKKESKKSNKLKSNIIKNSVTAESKVLGTSNITDDNYVEPFQNNTIPNQKVSMHTRSLAKDSHTHDNVVSLYRAYKNIYSPTTFTHNMSQRTDSQIKLDCRINNDTSERSHPSNTI